MGENIVFKDADGRNYIVSFPILNQPVRSMLRLWVEYDIGSLSYSTYEYFKRGYYLYFSVEECCSMGRILVCGGDNHKVLLGEVTRKSEKAHRRFAEKAGACAKEIIAELYNGVFEIDLEHGVSTPYGSSAIGMYKGLFSGKH